MKRFLFYSLTFLLILSFAVAEDPIDLEGIEDAAEQIEGTVKDIEGVLGGDVEFKDILNKTNAEKRVEEINKYIGPITKVLFGYGFSLSWLFLFAFLMWILLIELVLMPVSTIFELNIFGSLAIATIIATLSMQAFGDKMVVFLESLVITWKAGLIVLFLVIIVMAVYSIIFRFFGNKLKALKKESKKEKRKRDYAIIHARAEVAKKELES
tara:strand:+ start:1158 stop:1790 length:633 start_codon:yes stop_codon:yes gene_type:complete